MGKKKITINSSRLIFSTFRYIDPTTKGKFELTFVNFSRPDTEGRRDVFEEVFGRLDVLFADLVEEREGLIASSPRFLLFTTGAKGMSFSRLDKNHCISKNLKHTIVFDWNAVVNLHRL